MLGLNSIPVGRVAQLRQQFEAMASSEVSPASSVQRRTSAAASEPIQNQVVAEAVASSSSSSSLIPEAKSALSEQQKEVHNEIMFYATHGSLGPENLNKYLWHLIEEKKVALINVIDVTKLSDRELRCLLAALNCRGAGCRSREFLYSLTMRPLFNQIRAEGDRRDTQSEGLVLTLITVAATGYTEYTRVIAGFFEGLAGIGFDFSKLQVSRGYDARTLVSLYRGINRALDGYQNLSAVGRALLIAFRDEFLNRERAACAQDVIQEPLEARTSAMALEALVQMDTRR